MIGQVADDFELSLLDGSKFRLKDHADKIIVLDFWATWCGPCVAALPDYIAATSEFDSSKVIFVAVNQQEASDQIRGFLTERDLSPIVALDRNGEIGQQFKVSGIPHTVILGKGNVIEDVHVGYQQGGGESMQISIQQLLDGTWKRPTPEAAPAKPVTPPKDPI
jgi:thiol-disulfide isomerase/thioredoxin